MTTTESVLRVVGEDLAFDGQFLSVRRRRFENRRTGGSGVWEVVERKTHGRIVAVAAVTALGALVINRIFRIPLLSWVLELPAGLSDVAGEAEEALARRELLEETGYRVGPLTLLAAGPFHAGLSADILAIYGGTGAEKVALPTLETGEDIEVLEVPLARAEDFFNHPPEGVLVDIKLFSVLRLLEGRKRA